MGVIDWRNGEWGYERTTWLADMLVFLPPLPGNGSVLVTKHTSTAFEFREFLTMSEAHLKGSGFVYDSDFAPLKGTIKSVSTTHYDENKIGFSGLEVSVAKYNAAADHPGKLAALVKSVLSGADTIKGGAHDDEIFSYGGKDFVRGGAGDDTLIGGAGGDILDGGKGNDLLAGGAGPDHFRFTVKLKGGNSDDIADLSHGTDKIDLAKGVFKALGSSISGKEFVARDGDHLAQKASQHIIYDKQDGTLWYDADGNGEAAAVRFATLTDKPALLDVHDFLIV